MKMPFEIIEKDYWVVLILERLFSLENLKSHLTYSRETWSSVPPKICEPGISFSFYWPHLSLRYYPTVVYSVEK